MVAVLIGNRPALREEDHRQLQRVARGGLACGVQLVLLDVPVTLNAPVETVRRGRRPARAHLDDRPVRAVELDPPLPAGRRSPTPATRSPTSTSEWRSRIGSFDDLLPPTGSWGGDAR